MGTEIERKFLVTGDGWRAGAVGREIRQGFLSRVPERTVRVRVAGERAWLTVKGRTRGATRAEFEYEIPLADGRELLALCEGPLIEKTRHALDHGGREWIVDEFRGENAGLVVAEIELAGEEEAFDRPVWLGAEVTDDARYYNASLSVRPYRRW